MSNQHRPRSVWQLFTLSVSVLLCGGTWHSVPAQIPNTAEIPPQMKHAENPKTYLSHASRKRLDNRTNQPSNNPSQPSGNSVPDTKREDIERAIQAGNDARDHNDYDLALTSYRKVAEELDPKESRAYYGLGNVYSDLYCTDSAIDAYIRALRIMKDFREALLALGYAYMAKERYDDAEEQFKTALPQDAGVKIALGSVYAKKGKYQEAIDQINQVINDKSIEATERASAHIALGVVFGAQRKSKEAIAQFEAAIRLKPDLAVAYLLLGDAQLSFAYSKLHGIDSVNVTTMQERQALAASAKQAAANIEKAREAREHPYNHPSVHEDLALALAYQFRYQEAISEINNYFSEIENLETKGSAPAMKCAAGFDSLKAVGYWYSGDVYFLEALFETDNQRKTGFLNEALKQFNLAVKLKQDFVSAYGMLAVIYDRRQNREEALAQYTKALLYETNPINRGSYYYFIGIQQTAMGRFDDAVDSIQQAIRLNPNDPRFYEGLATICVNQGKLEETFTHLKKATELRNQLGLESGAEPDPYYYLGTAYTIRFIQKKNEEDFTEAVKWLKKAIEIRSSYAIAYGSLATAYWKHGNADEALATYLKAAQYDQKDPVNYEMMGRVYFELKHNDEAAIEKLNQAIKLKEDYAEAYRRLGLVYHHKNNNAEAIKQMLDAIKYDPKFVETYLDLADIYKSQVNYPEAIQILTRATGIAPTDSQPYKGLAKVYEEQGKNGDAAHSYEEAINRLSADDLSTRNLYLGRIARLRGQYAEAIEIFKKLNFPEEPGQPYFEIGVTHVASQNKKAALEQYQQLVQLKSPLAEELLKKINEMK